MVFEYITLKNISHYLLGSRFCSSDDNNYPHYNSSSDSVIFHGGSGSGGNVEVVVVEVESIPSRRNWFE